MQSKTTIRGHALHPILVMFPVAAYVGALAAFITFAVTHSVVWWKAALWANLIGVGLALVAAIPGFIDLFGVVRSGTRARSIGLAHMGLNLTALTLFAANLVMQQGAWTQMPHGLRAVFHLAHIGKPDLMLALILAGSGVGVTVLAGLLGVKLVRSFRIGLSDADVVKPGRLSSPTPPIFPAAHRP